MSDVSLKTLLIPEKTVSIAYDKERFPKFEVKLSHAPREQLSNMRKRCITTKLDPKTKQPSEDLDEDLFLNLFCDRCIKGWSGLKYKYLEELLLVDVSDQDPEDELPFNEENVEVLMKNSPEFDTWVMTEVGYLGNFSTSKSKN